MAGSSRLHVLVGARHRLGDQHPCERAVQPVAEVLAPDCEGERDKGTELDSERAAAQAPRESTPPLTEEGLELGQLRRLALRSEQLRVLLPRHERPAGRKQGR